LPQAHHALWVCGWIVGNTYEAGGNELGGHRRTSGASSQTRARELTSAELWLSVTLPGMSMQRSKRTKNEDLYKAVTRSATPDTGLIPPDT